MKGASRRARVSFTSPPLIRFARDHATLHEVVVNLAQEDTRGTPPVTSRTTIVSPAANEVQGICGGPGNRSRRPYPD